MRDDMLPWAEHHRIMSEVDANTGKLLKTLAFIMLLFCGSFFYFGYKLGGL